MPFMWADTLLSAERAHLLRLLVWSAANLLVGTAMLAWMRVRRRSSPLLEHFAIQATAWGAVEAVAVAFSWPGLAARDLAGATRLDRFLWMNIGLDVGCLLVGLTLAVVGWRIGRRLGLMGAGVGVITQSLALLLLDLALAARISR